MKKAFKKVLIDLVKDARKTHNERAEMIQEVETDADAMAVLVQAQTSHVQLLSGLITLLKTEEML